MERTNTAALGGPATAENLADMAGAPGGMQDIMGLASSAAHGNAFTFIRNAYDMASRIGRGRTSAAGRDRAGAHDRETPSRRRLWPGTSRP